MTRESSYHKIGFLIGFMILFCIVWLLYPQMYMASDPALYSFRAYDIGKNLDFGEGTVFDHRLGVILPVALIYKILGINILTTNLWPLLSVLLIFLTVWFALPTTKARIIGLVLCFFSAPLLTASTVLLPDIIATAFMGAAALLLFKREKLVQNQHWLSFALASAFVIFIAFLAKLSAYWILPLWSFYLVLDIKRKKFILLSRYYIPLIAAGLFLVGIYLLVCYIVWDNPLARFQSVQNLTGQHLWSTDKLDHSYLLRRLTVSPIKVLFMEYFLLPILVLVSIWKAPSQLRGWILYVILCIGFFWFGTTSFTKYEPMPLAPRMILPALPGIYILSAFLISQIEWRSKKHPTKKIILLGVFLGFLLFSSFISLKTIQAHDQHEQKAMGILKNELKENPQTAFLLVTTDYRNSLALSFYFAFEYPEELKVVFINDLKPEDILKRKTLVFIDKKRSAMLHTSYGQEDNSGSIKGLNQKTLYDGNYIQLLEINNPESLVGLTESPNEKSHKN